MRISDWSADVCSSDLDKPFVIGDFIIVDDCLGSVEHVGLKTTRIRSLGGEQLIFANSDLLKARVRNYKRMQERSIVFKFGILHETPSSKLADLASTVTTIQIGRASGRERVDQYV